MGKIFMAAPLNPKDLAPMVKQREIIAWETRTGGLIATNDLRIGNIVLKSTPLDKPDQSQVAKVISEAVAKEGRQLLDLNDKFLQWQNRILSLRIWRQGEAWPDVNTDRILENNLEWLGPYYQQVRKNEDLKKIDLTEALAIQLSWEKQQLLEQLAPQRLTVPSGSKIKLEYYPDGRPPTLSVRLQEIFGLAETPSVNAGATPVLLHLLSPGFKPVQVTADLKSFWNETYFEVRKELRNRYPKHEWPEDPWNAQPLRGVRKRNKG
jgi:ATP-dependent helicase HrpB